MWDYTDKVMDHFRNPRNVGVVENPDGTGEVGNISCGDALKLTFKLDAEGRIADVKFQTFGCTSAIASSSVLTEMVKGMTLDDALKVTNQDIARELGGLPEEKMHCSVMGMEALQAAIADCRGEHVEPEDDDDHEGRVVCHCFGVTDNKIRKLALENKLTKAEDIRNYSKAGGGCGCCLEEIQEILDGVWREKKESPEESVQDAFLSLPIIQRVIRIQEVIDREIVPMLERDGGSVEFLDLNDKVIKVRLKGRCASCPSASVTLRHTVEGKIKELLSPELSVESVN
jgi:NifU-like protein